MQMVPLDGKPRHLRAVTADVEKQQAVVEAFRVSCFRAAFVTTSDPLMPIGNPACLVSVRYDFYSVQLWDGSVNGFELTWSERDAMGCDIYHPVIKLGSNLTYAGGIGYMVLDAMDSLILLGLDEEYQRAREWVANKLSFDRDGIYNTFEVNLPPLKAYEWTNHAERPVVVARRCFFRLPFVYWVVCYQCTSCQGMIRYTWRKPSTWPIGSCPSSRPITGSR